MELSFVKQYLEMLCKSSPERQLPYLIPILYYNNYNVFHQVPEQRLIHTDIREETFPDSRSPMLTVTTVEHPYSIHTLGMSVVFVVNDKWKTPHITVYQ